jgi:hypothetical protein
MACCWLVAHPKTLWKSEGVFTAKPEDTLSGYYI